MPAQALTRAVRPPVVLPGCRDAGDARQLELPATRVTWQTVAVRLLLCAVIVAGCSKHEPPAPRAATAKVAPADPPPVALRPVPADVASKVALKELVHGLDRPVALVAAPGDPRRRLYIVEQHAGRDGAESADQCGDQRDPQEAGVDGEVAAMDLGHGAGTK